jgi:hypothetical protein
MIRLVDHLEETLRKALQESEGTELDIPCSLTLSSSSEFTSQIMLPMSWKGSRSVSQMPGERERERERERELALTRVKRCNNAMIAGDERSVRLENIREDVTFPIENNVRHHVVLPEGCPPCRFYFEALSFYLAEDLEGRTRSLRLLGLFTGPLYWTFSVLRERV